MSGVRSANIPGCWGWVLAVTSEAFFHPGKLHIWQVVDEHPVLFVLLIFKNFYLSIMYSTCLWLLCQEVIELPMVPCHVSSLVQTYPAPSQDQEGTRGTHLDNWFYFSGCFSGIRYLFSPKYSCYFSHWHRDLVFCIKWKKQPDLNISSYWQTYIFILDRDIA